jgi:hypothetical protein
MLFLLVSCTTTPQVNGPVRNVDSALSDEYYRRAELTLADGKVYETFQNLMNSLDRYPGNEKSRTMFEDLSASLVSESHFLKEPITRGRGMEHPLSFLLFYEQGNSIEPLPDIPVTFRFLEGSGVITQGAVTNDAGIAKGYIERIDEFEQGITVEAVPVLRYNGSSIELSDLSQTYVYRTVSLLEQTQHVYILFENPDPDWGTQQFSHLKESLSELFRKNEFTDVVFHNMTEEILFNRALSLDTSSIGVLTEADRLFLMRVETSFVSQQSIDFFFSAAHIVLNVIDTRVPAVSFSDEVQRRGAGKTRERSAYQAVVNTVADITENLDPYLKETRRIHGL